MEKVGRLLNVKKYIYNLSQKRFLKNDNETNKPEQNSFTKYMLQRYQQTKQLTTNKKL